MVRKHSRDHGGGPIRAIEALTVTGAVCTVHEYGHGPTARSLGEETVEKLGIDPTQAFKTLMVCLEPTGESVVGCIPVRTHLSMKLIAKAAGAKSAAMVDPVAAQHRAGYVVDGISPLRQITSYRVFIDSVYLDHKTVITSDGCRDLSVKLSPLDPAELTDAKVTDLAQV